MKVKLGDIFEIGSGGTPSKSHPEYYKGNIPWVKTGDLKSEYLYEVEDFISEEGLKNSSAKMYEENTVLIAMYGATIGATSILKLSACTNQACAAFKENEKVIPEYLYYFLRSQKERFVKDGVGGAQPNISAGYLKKVEMEIPLLENQKEIIGILDKTSEIISRMDQEIRLLDNLIKARFVEMFGDKGYPVLKWKDVFNTTTGKLDSNAAVEDGEYPFFTCSKEALRIDKFAYDQEALLLAGNNAAGKYDVKYYKGKFNAYQRTYVLDKFTEDIQFVRFILKVNLPIRIAIERSTSNTPYIVLSTLAGMKLFIPPKSLQQCITNLLLSIEAKLSIHTALLVDYSNLKSYLLQQMFI